MYFTWIITCFKDKDGAIVTKCLQSSAIDYFYTVLCKLAFVISESETQHSYMLTHI